MTQPRKVRDVVVVLFPGFQILDVTGPSEVFSLATRIREWEGKPPPYRLHWVAKRDGSVAASSGLEIVAKALSKAPPSIDTLLVAGGQGTRAAVRDAVLIDWIGHAADGSRRVTSVCTGAFLLAQAGLLDGRSATTHWGSCSRLARSHPRVSVEADRIYVKDGNVYTSAGVTAGIDLALALVAEDCGRRLALHVARELVVFLHRPGGQSQFSTPLATQAKDTEPLDEIRAWIEDHLGDDLSVPNLARRAGMSSRNFARRFTESVGRTPARYVQSARIDAARRRLEESQQGLDRIATDCGLGSADSMRRAFVAALSTTPSDYRARFATRAKAT